jgi:cytoskeletal protein CcmA (bactofilin family)
MAKIEEGNLSAVNLISKTTKIEGTIHTEADIRIDGELTGNLVTSCRLIVGVTGKIKGEITCKSSEIEGTIEGKIKVSELLSLKSTANFIGELTTGQLLIEPGAIFSGTCAMDRKNKN